MISVLAWHHHKESTTIDKEKAQKWREKHAHLADFLLADFLARLDTPGE